jgi:sulfotransferase
MSSPAAALVGTLHTKMTGGEYGIFFNDEKRATVLKSVLSAYYADQVAGLGSNPVVFDTSRSWTGRMALLAALFPEMKVICCVRSIAWIIDSVESMLAKNPLQVSSIFDFKPGLSVYARTEMLMNSETGFIGLPWSTLREAWFGEHANHLIVVTYDNLTKDPERTMRYLYDLLEEPYFHHDFDNVIYDEPDYDAQIGMPGMHTVKQKVAYKERKPVLPPDIFAKFATSHFWENRSLNPRGVTVI